MKNSVDFINGRVELIDQTLLPRKFRVVRLSTWQQCYQAIKKMVVRGAPAIGVTAGLALVLAAYENRKKNIESFASEIRKASEKLFSARPTAVNLRWGLDKMLGCLDDEIRAGKSIAGITASLEKKGRELISHDIEVNRRIAENGLKIFRKEKSAVLTHCNAGALATVNIGTALGIVRAGWKAGKISMVYADETRPRLQGGKLTAWELMQDSIDVTVIADNMAGFLMQQGKIDLVIVGADRIAVNGDVCNKIGTYAAAVLAKVHGIPFYVAAPLSTFDHKIKSGKDIPIEERDRREMTHAGNVPLLAEGANVINPAFDVTPAEYVTGIITEEKIIKPLEAADFSRLQPL